MAIFPVVLVSARIGQKAGFGWIKWGYNRLFFQEVEAYEKYLRFFLMREKHAVIICMKSAQKLD